MAKKKKKKFKEIKGNEELLESIRIGIRLDTPAPIIFKDKKKYSRKEKHKQLLF